jgi:endonuclease YncB( thermonuclease family)
MTGRRVPIFAAIVFASVVPSVTSAEETTGAAPKTVRLIAPELVSPVPSDGELERLPAIEPPATKKPFQTVVSSDARLRLLPLPIAESAGVLIAGGYRIAIAGIGTPDVDERCGTEKWKCGAAARAHFRSFLRSRSVRCRVPENRPSDSETIVTACSVAGLDIGAWLVSQGWARRSGDVYAQEAKLAEDKRRGFFGPAPPVYVPSFSAISAEVSDTP